MEYTSRSLSRWLAVVGALLLSSCSPNTLAAAAPQISLAQQFVVPQSHLRAIRGLRPLRWSDALADQAARFVGDCGAASAGFVAGVNVFRARGAAWQPSDAVAAWAEQAEHYDFGSGACAAGRQCAQFRQVMWRGSQEVGCAAVECPSGETVMACHYEPRGNVLGQRPF